MYPSAAQLQSGAGVIDLATIPDWLGTAVLGALLAVFGYVGTKVAEWFATRRKEERGRRARLAELLALLRAGDTAFKVQCDNRDRLAALIRQRDPTLKAQDDNFDDLFTRSHPDMSPQELELHDIVRAITVHTIQPLNMALLEWLRADTDFRVRRPDRSPRGKLAQYLADLEAHLLLWHAKYQAWIPEHPERALVYLADEKSHGIGFPGNGTELVTSILHHRRPIRA